MPVVTYLLQVSACTAIFYAFYYLFLRRLTFFTINRWYLMATLLITFVIPILTIKVSPDSAPIIKEVVYINQLQTFDTSAAVTFTPQIVEPTINWLDVLQIVYLVTVAGLAIKLIITVVWLFYKVKNKKSTKIGNVHILHGDKKLNNGSFLNYIFLNEDELNPEEVQQIIEHEMLHVKLCHSIDRIISKIAQIILWFNPFIYLYSRAIEENHEFEVDREIGRSNDKSKYADMLVHLSVARQDMLYNSFSMVPLKRRIIMLYTKPTNHMKKVIYLLALPVVMLSCLAFAQFKNDAALKVENFKLSKQGPVNLSDVQTQKKTTLESADTIKKKPKPSLSEIKKSEPAAPAELAANLEEPQPFFSRIPFEDSLGKHDKIIFRYDDITSTTIVKPDVKTGAFIDGEFYKENELNKLPASKVARLGRSHGILDVRKIPAGYHTSWSFRTKNSKGETAEEVVSTKGMNSNDLDRLNREIIANEVFKRSRYPQFYKRVKFNIDGKQYDYVVCTVGKGLISVPVELDAKTGLLIDGVFYDEEAIKKLPDSVTKNLEMWREGFDAAKVPRDYIAAFTLRTKTTN